MKCLLTLTNDLLIPSGLLLSFHIRPNFGAICLSIRNRLPQEIMLTSQGGLPVPYGLGTGLIGGMECVEGA